MAADSLDADYFDGIFQGDADPWGLASSDYEAAKFARTIAAIADRHHARALEVGCAHGVLTRMLAPYCDDLLAIDISRAAIERASARLSDLHHVRLERMTFPREAPTATAFDLVVLSEVAYYWSDDDLALAATWLAHAMARQGRLLLVHWTGATDYPQTGDAAVEKLWTHLSPLMDIEMSDRTPDYRLDLWRRR